MSDFATTITETTELGTTQFHLPVVELTMLVTTIIVFILFAIILMGMIIHLMIKTCRKWEKAKNHKETQKVIIFLIITIVGISSFEISLIIIITVITQVLLLDDEIKSSIISPEFFLASYPVFEYMIGILDSVGHLTMLAVFIARFEYVFKNEIFNQSKVLIRCMYLVLAVLAIVSFVILVFIMPSEMYKAHILAWEIGWEACVESMIIFILMLFMYNLYKLLSLSLMSHLSQNKNKAQLLSEITKISLEHSSSDRKKRRAMKNKGSKSTKSINQMTIDGATVDPIEPMSNNKSHLSVNKSIKSTVSENGNISDNGSGASGDDGDVSDNPSVDDNKSVSPRTQSNPIAKHSQALEILSAMNKMTLLVIIAATASVFTIIGNFIIESVGEFNEKDLRNNHDHSTVDHDLIWVFILPSLDMVITSFMLYLQFNFTHKTYRMLCHCCDSVFLKCMLCIIGYCWRKDDIKTQTPQQDDIKTPTPQFMAEQVDLQTQSTATGLTPQTGSDPEPPVGLVFK
eukprot:428837_1